MKILLVEDDETLIAQLELELPRVAPGCELLVARSLNAASGQLAGDWFDLVVSDLRIPTTDHQMDAKVVYGQAVRAMTQEASPGTPILVLSAFLDLSIMKELLEEAEKEDVFGSGEKHPLLDAFEKKKLPDFIRRVGDIATEVGILNDIAIATSVTLSRGERRVLQLFARINGGNHANLQEVGGGLSDARTFQISVEDGRGKVTARALAKIADIHVVKDEHTRCSRVASVLPIGSCVGDLRIISTGAGPLGGVFYPFANTHSHTMFGLLLENPALALDALLALRRIEKSWQKEATVDQRSVREVRLQSLTASAFSDIVPNLNPIEWETFESRNVSVKICCQHGDLHGANILVSEDGAPLLIDYGDVADATSVLDPITLELSTIFHPDAKAARKDWPSLEASESWADVEIFVKGCPFPEFIRECRAWAQACGRGDREIAATAYSVAIRQLKYDATLHPIARAIAQSAIGMFE